MASGLLEQGQGPFQERPLPGQLLDDGEMIGAGHVQDVHGAAAVPPPVRQGRAAWR